MMSSGGGIMTSDTNFGRTGLGTGYTRTALPSLSTSLYAFVGATLLVVSLGGLALLRSSTHTLEESALDRAVRTRTAAAGQMLTRTLHADWRDLQYLAGRLTGTDADAEGLMDGMRGDGERISWIGHAGVDGVVRTATGGMLAGADVGARPWFRNGLRGPFAGDVHEAVLLAQLLGAEGGAPLHFVDLALPITGADGEPSGVLGMHIDAAWVERLLNDAADSLGIDLFLVNPTGAVTLSSVNAAPNVGDLAILQAAQLGVQQSGQEVWPDGQTYFSSLLPSVIYADLPEFGWRLIGRLEPEAFRPDVSSFRGKGLWAIVAMLAALAGLSAIYAAAVLRPLERLAGDADRIAAGEAVYPAEGQNTREGARLSAALARLQAMMPVRRSA